MVDSVQNRKTKWHAISKQSIELLLGYDIEVLITNNRNNLLKMDQKKLMETLKINFEYLYESFFTDDMFFY